MKKEIPRKNHYIPRVYLNNFCDKKGMLNVFDRVTQKGWLQKPRSTAYIKDFYIVNDIDNGMLTNYEEALSKIESDFPLFFHKIENHEILDVDDQNWWAYYFSLQYTRTPEFQRFYLDISDKVFNETYNFILNDSQLREELIKSLPKDISDKDIAKFKKDVEEGNIKLNTSKHEVVHWSLNMATDISVHVKQMMWGFLFNHSDTPFITCDNPIIIDRPFSEGNNLPRSLKNPNCLKIFPLSKNICFIAYGDIYKLGYGKVFNNMIHVINKKILLNSNKYIFSHSNKYVENLQASIQDGEMDLRLKSDDIRYYIHKVHYNIL